MTPAQFWQIEMNNRQIQSEQAAQQQQQIGNALSSIAEMYGEQESQKAKGRAFKDTFKIISPSLGINQKDLESLTGGAPKSDQDWYQVSQIMAPIMPSMFNAQLSSARFGNQQTLANQQAANQAAARQPAANQVPLGAQAPAATANPETLPAPAFIDPSVKTRSLLKR